MPVYPALKRWAKLFRAYGARFRTKGKSEKRIANSE